MLRRRFVLEFTIRAAYHVTRHGHVYVISGNKILRLQGIRLGRAWDENTFWAFVELASYFGKFESPLRTKTPYRNVCSGALITELEFAFASGLFGNGNQD